MDDVMTGKQTWRETFREGATFVGYITLAFIGSIFILALLGPVVKPYLPASTVPPPSIIQDCPQVAP